MATVQSVQRIQSIDIVRGLIMVIMTLDHVRDYFHITAFTADPLAPDSTTGAVFFTRWITHLCAPTFMLLSGVSAYLAGQRRTPAETSSFLIKRGFWLVFVDIVFMTFAFTFDITYKNVLLAVLWALGTSMITLGLAVRFFKPKIILILGLIIVFGHNLLDYVKLAENTPADIVLRIFFTGAGTFLPRGDGGNIAFLYVIIPWAGIMMSGYGLGILYSRDFEPARRRRILVITGVAAIVLFIVLRLINAYGDPVPWSTQKEPLRTFFSFMNVRKYPPSLMFVLVTQGITLIVLSLAEHIQNRVTDFFTVFGKVPFFYFLLHFYFVHLLSMIVVLNSGYTWEQATADELFFKFRPDEFGFSLPVVYLVWVFVVVVLYFPCKWFGTYRERHRSWWLSYL